MHVGFHSVHLNDWNSTKPTSLRNRYFAAICFSLFSIFAFSQATTTSYGNFAPCSGPIALYVFDFTSTGSNQITQAGINIQNSDNQCCSEPSNAGCLFFDVYVDPGATGVSFSQTGAGGNVDIYYENCDSIYGANEDICLDPSFAYTDASGNVYHRFMFCRSGQTTYDFTFTQIVPTFPDDIGVTEGCTIDLSVQDLDPASVVWTSIAPGVQGQWDGLLDCPTGCLDVVITPVPGSSPPSISYQVCGSLAGACNTNTYCDTVNITIYPDLFADAGPDLAFCDGSFVPVTSTGTAIGGTPPFTYDWTGFAGAGNGFSFTTVDPASTATVDFTQPGSYELTITDANNCAIAVDTVEVFTFATAIQSVITTAPLSICNSPNPTIPIDGYVTETFTGVWSAPSGVFDVNNIDGTATAPANTPQTVNWTPTPGTTGIVTLILTPTNTAGCPNTPDSIDIDLTQFTSTLSTSPVMVACNGDANGAIDLTVTPGAPAYGVASFLWSTAIGSGLVVGNEDQNGLTVGDYQVVVTDVNGCVDSILTTITEPPVLTGTVTGDALLCNGDADGNVTGTISGGTAPYVITLNETGATLNVATDGGAYDFSGLSAAVSGGFDTYTVTVTDANGVANGCTATVGPVNMVEPQPLVVTINGDALLCNGDADGNVTGTISGGTAPYVITLNETGATLNVATDGGAYDFSGLSAAVSGGFDTYTVTVTDANGVANGCTATVGPVNMVEPDTLNVSLVPSIYAGGWNTSGCVNDGTIDLTVTGGVGGYTFDWDIDGTGDFDDSEDLNNLLPGWYVIQTVDLNGCPYVDSILLEAPPTLNSSTAVTTNYNGEHVSCMGASDGGVSVTTFAGTPSYSYEWTDASGSIISSTDVVDNIPAGMYYVTITDQNFCSSFDSIEVIDAPALTSAIVVSSNYNGQDISCFGASDGSIDFTVNGGTPAYSITWTDTLGNHVGNTEDLNGIPSGTYFVQLVDLNGCIIDTSITLTDPPLLEGIATITSDYNGQDVSCFQSSNGTAIIQATGGTPGLNYEWEDGQGNIISNTTNGDDLSAGSYTITVTDVNGCQLIENIIVTEPTALTLNIDVLTDYFGVAVSCETHEDGEIEAIVGGGTPGYNYVWNTNPIQTTAGLTNLGEGTYTVIVTDANGCQITETVTLEANPMPEVNPDPSMEVCQGETVVFSSNAGPNESCQWLFSNGMELNDCGPNTVYIADVGCYDMQLIVTNEFGCMDSTSVQDYICIRPNPVAAFSASDHVVSVLETTIDFINQSSGATDYEWNFGDGTGAFTVDASHQYALDQPGEYTVTLEATNQYGCSDTATAEIEVRDVLLFYVPNTFTPDGDEYNNVFQPVIGAGVSPQNYQFLIFNRWGEIIFESLDPSFGWDGTYRGQECQDGTYTWKLQLRASQNVIESGSREEFVGHVNLIR